MSIIPHCGVILSKFSINRVLVRQNVGPVLNERGKNSKITIINLMRFLNIVLNNLIWFLVFSAFVFFSLASDRFLNPVTISNILISISALGFLVQTFYNRDQDPYFLKLHLPSDKLYSNL